MITDVKQQREREVRISAVYCKMDNECFMNDRRVWCRRILFTFLPTSTDIEPFGFFCKNYPKFVASAFSKTSFLCDECSSLKISPSFILTILEAYPAS